MGFRKRFHDLIRGDKNAVPTNSDEDSAPELIRSFVYLDNQRLYSLSSQLFGGLTEYEDALATRLLRGVKKQPPERSLIDPLGRRREFEEHGVLQETTQSRRLFHDHAYSLFEQKLSGYGALQEFGGDTSDLAKLNASQQSFVKIVGWPVIVDMQSISKFADQINDIQVRIALVRHSDEITQGLLEAYNKLQDEKDPNKRKKLQFQLEQTHTLDKIAKRIEVQLLSEALRENLPKLLEYFDSGHVDILVSPTYDGAPQVLASLSREWLLESVESLFKRYSRRPETPFVLVGLVTRGTRGESQMQQGSSSSGASEKNMPQSLITASTAIDDLSNTFDGAGSRFSVVEPIAVYREIPIKENSDERVGA